MKQDYLTPLQQIDREHIPAFDFHIHTSWTDGTKPVREMYDRAVSSGLQWVLFSEHARKTSEEWFGKFADEVRSFPNKGCHALVGVETKVADFEGELDCTANILDRCDLVMASVHRFPGEKGTIRGFGDVCPEEAPEIEFRLAWAVLENPNVDILGHPFGMSYRRYHVTPPDDFIRSLIKKAASQKVAIEINSRYHPDLWKWIQWCQEAGALISLGSNAHCLEEVGRIGRILKGEEQAWIPSACS